MRYKPMPPANRVCVLAVPRRNVGTQPLREWGVIGITALWWVISWLFACGEAGAQDPGGLPAGVIMPDSGMPTAIAESIPRDETPGFAGSVDPAMPPVGGETVCEPSIGPIRRAMRHVHATLIDRVIGYPELFYEPPPGAYVFQHYLVNKRAAIQHRFLLYQSDFWSDTTQLTLDGAERLGRMIADLGRWPGPILIEHTADTPDLAARRKSAIMQQIALAGVPIASERILVAASPYRGTIGDFENAVYQQWLGIQGATVNYLGRTTNYPAGWPTFMPYPVLLAPGGGGGN